MIRHAVKNVGEYQITATISSENFYGKKEFTVHVYSEKPGENMPNNDDEAEIEGNNTVAVAVAVKGYKK